jgi:hypothetical protein
MQERKINLTPLYFDKQKTIIIQAVMTQDYFKISTQRTNELVTANESMQGRASGINN